MVIKKKRRRSRELSFLGGTQRFIFVAVLFFLKKRTGLLWYTDHWRVDLCIRFMVRHSSSERNDKTTTVTQRKKIVAASTFNRKLISYDKTMMSTTCPHRGPHSDVGSWAGGILKDVIGFVINDKLASRCSLQPIWGRGTISAEQILTCESVKFISLRHNSSLLQLGLWTSFLWTTPLTEHIDLVLHKSLFIKHI